MRTVVALWRDQKKTASEAVSYSHDVHRPEQLQCVRERDGVSGWEGAVGLTTKVQFGSQRFLLTLMEYEKKKVSKQTALFIEWFRDVAIPLCFQCNVTVNNILTGSKNISIFIYVTHENSFIL